MGAKKRSRVAPYWAKNSAAHDASRARTQSRLARLGAKALGMKWLYRLSLRDDRLGDKAGRVLYEAGRREIEVREATRRLEKRHEVPEICTSFGVHIERMWRDKGEIAKSKLFRACVKVGDKRVMEMLADGKVEKAREAIIRIITG